MKNSKYKVSIGIWKSMKNVLIVWGIPALILLVDNLTQWISGNYHASAIQVMGLIAYFVKNYIQNKQNKFYKVIIY